MKVKRTKKRIFILAPLALASACSGVSSIQMGEDSRQKVLIYGDNETVKSLMDGMQAMAVANKVDPHRVDNYSDLRKNQEETKKLRFTIVNGGKK